MGIYTNGHIYGVRIYNNDNELYSKIYDDNMTQEQIQEVKQFFETLEKENMNLHISFYVEVSSTYEPGNFMSWWPSNKNVFIKWINGENIVNYLVY